ncbi:MAG: carboxypeptidase-like regulatory domain-containing protein [Myxococcota bacterium]
MKMPRALVTLVVLGTLASACPDDTLLREGAPCQADEECGGPLLCLLGTCVDPRARDLGKVDLQVSPLEDSGLKTQAFPGKDTRRSEREDIVLRQTVHATVEVCFDCSTTERGTVPGDLTLAGLERIKGHRDFETVVVGPDGMATASLLDLTPYDPVLFPTDPDLPLLRGRQVVPSQQLIAAVVQVEVPSPHEVYMLTGRVVLDGYTGEPRGVDGMKVWLMEGELRATRDVLTSDGGNFRLKVLKSQASGLTLHIAPANASDPYPAITVSDVNLDEDRDMGDVTLGPLDPAVLVQGTVRGPNALGIEGAVVRFTGPAGKGILEASVVSGAGGAYEISLPPGTYQRAVVPPQGAGAALKQEAGFKVDPDPSRRSDPNVTLDIAFNLCGTIRAHDGSAIGNASVRAFRVGNSGAAPGPASDVTVDVKARTNGDGRYCMALDPGQYLVTGTPPEGVRHPARTDLVDMGSAELVHDFALPPAALLVGTVKAPDGTPLKLARVKAFSPVLTTRQGALDLGETFTNDDGTFTLVVPDLAGVGAR